MKKKEFKIKSDYKEVAVLCESVRQFCLEVGLQTNNCGEIEICLTEALNNIIKHAYKENFNKVINISITTDKDWIEIKLVDTGIPRRVFEKPTLEFDPEDIDSLPEGGMGLYIIDQLMNEIDYKTENGVNIFTMKKIFA